MQHDRGGPIEHIDTLHLPPPSSQERRVEDEAGQNVDDKMRSQLAHYDPLKSLMPLSLSPSSSVDWSMPWSDPLSSRQDSTIACRYCRMRKIRCSGFETTDNGRCSNCERFDQDCIFNPVVSAQTLPPALAHMVWRGAGQLPPMYGASGQSLPPPIVNFVPRRIASPPSDLHSFPSNSRRSIPPIVTPHDTEQVTQVAIRRPLCATSTLHVDANYSQPPVDDVMSRAILMEEDWKWGSRNGYSQYEIIKQERDFAELVYTRGGPPMAPLDSSMGDIEDRISPSSIVEARNRMTSYHRKVSRPGNDTYQGNTETKPPGAVIRRSIANLLDTKNIIVSSTIENETFPKEVSNKNPPTETKITGTTICSPPQSGREPNNENDTSAIKKSSTMKDDLSIHSLDSDLSYIPTPFDNAMAGADGRFQDAESQTSASVETSEGILNNLTIKMKQGLLDELLELAWTECENSPELIDGDTSFSNTSSGADLNVSTSTSLNTNPNTNRSGQKRQRSSKTEDGEGGSGSEDDNRDDNNKRKRGRLSASDSSRHIKCPYYQRAPEKYTRAACRGRGFADLAKLKDHLKRVHSQPLRCTRCQEAMASEETYAEHLRQDNFCPKRPATANERISAQLWPKLEFKKPPFSLQSSVEAKWRLIYKILFPDDREIPTPYDDRDISSRMEQLANAIEEELANELEKVLDPTISRLRGKLPSIIKRCKSRVLGIPNDDDDHRDAELLTGPVNNNSATSSVDSRIWPSKQLYQCQNSGGNSNTEKNTSGEHSGAAVRSRKEASLNSSWTTLDTSSHESSPPQMSHGPSAKALGKRPQVSMLTEDPMSAPPWSVMNTRNLLNAETMHEAYDTADMNQSHSPEDPAPAHSSKNFDHTINMQDNSEVHTGHSVDLLEDWNVLTSEFDVNQLMADWDKQEAAEVHKNGAWHCSNH